MIPLNQKPLHKPKHSSMNFRILLGILLFLFLIFLAFGIYKVSRQTLMRISADYYFPFLKSARLAENAIADQTLMLQSKYTLAKALRILMNENAMLSAERAVVIDLKKENAELRSLLKLGHKGTFTPVFAEVISRDPMSWQEQFQIDKGRKAGIEPGNPVVTVALQDKNLFPGVAVIGIIKSVSEHTSQVTTVLSQDFRMSVSLPKIHATGILGGSRKISDMKAVLRFIPLQAAPQAGQIVYTNAFSGNSPPGLPIGEIVSSGNLSQKKMQNLLFMETEVRPFESPAEVRFVAVFTKDNR